MTTTEVVCRLIVDFAQVFIAAGALLWAVQRFRLESSEKESALKIETSVRCSELLGNARFLAVFEIALSNIGRKVLVARKRRVLKDGRRKRYVWNDGVEKLRNACSLRLGRIAVDSEKAGEVDAGSETYQCYDWWSKDTGTELTGDSEFDLLSDYYDPGRKDIYFWLDPKEIQVCGVTVKLVPGFYFAKVTFVGDASNDQFWTRTFPFTVPPCTGTRKPLEESEVPD